MVAADAQRGVGIGEGVQVIRERIVCQSGLQCVRQRAFGDRFDDNRQRAGVFHAAQDVPAARTDGQNADKKMLFGLWACGGLTVGSHTPTQRAEARAWYCSYCKKLIIDLENC